GFIHWMNQLPFQTGYPSIIRIVSEAKQLVPCYYDLTSTERFQVQSSGFRGRNIPTMLMLQHDARIGLFQPLGVTAMRSHSCEISLGCILWAL
ncbi:MAG: hypothetical protein PVG08_01160, partial [Desulfobacterales bacterium]